MSSARFEAELIPDERLRRALAGFAWAAMLTGGLLIALLPVVLPVRLVLAASWFTAGLLEVRAMALGMARVERIRITFDGRVSGLAEGAVEPLQVLPGSVVLARLAWLRIRFADGLSYGELLAGDPRTSPAWRRLQLVWRQRSSVFGRPEGS